MLRCPAQKLPDPLTQTDIPAAPTPLTDEDRERLFSGVIENIGIDLLERRQYRRRGNWPDGMDL
jgi:hypothetical protein